MAKKRRERIYLIPRWSGLVFAFLLLLIFALGFAYTEARGLRQTVGIALQVAGVVAMIQSNDNLRGIELSACHSTPTAAGEEPVLELTLKNHAERERTGLQMRRGTQWRTAWFSRRPVEAGLPVIEAGATATVRLPLPATQRGRHAVPTLWACSVLPVGLCFAWKVFPGTGEYFVYPKPRGIPLEPGTGQGRHIGSLSALGGSEDVSGHRPYEAGDPLSRLDWRVFARSGKLVVRTLEDGSSGEVLLRWDDTRFVDGEEQRLEQLSCWIAQCVREERPFRLELRGAGGDLTSRNLTACYEALATFHGEAS